VKLFYAPGSVSLGVHIALEEAQVPYEAIRMDAQARARGGIDYLTINPKGRVPSLVTDQGVLTETPAILAWIAATNLEAQLMPTDPWQHAQAQSFNGYLATTVHVAHAHRYRGYRWASEESSFEDMRRKVPASMTECFQLIERELLGNPWVMGLQYTVCDGYLFTMSDWAEQDGVDMTTLPRVLAHRERVRDRPAVRRALAQVSARD
jgi:glutathione S-transferase